MATKGGPFGGVLPLCMGAVGKFRWPLPTGGRGMFKGAKNRIIFFLKKMNV